MATGYNAKDRHGPGRIHVEERRERLCALVYLDQNMGDQASQVGRSSDERNQQRVRRGTAQRLRIHMKANSVQAGVLVMQPLIPEKSSPPALPAEQQEQKMPKILGIPGATYTKETNRTDLASMPRKLTYPQEYALQRLKTNEWLRAWDINATSSTLFALERMGLVERKKVVERITGYDSTDYGWRKASGPTLGADSVQTTKEKL